MTRYRGALYGSGLQQMQSAETPHQIKCRTIKEKG